MIGKLTGVRESIMRYAVYLHYKQKMDANNGHPGNFAGSIPEEVMALKTNQERAFKLANEMFVAYEDAGKVNETSAEHLMPYLRFYTGNYSYYASQAKNILFDPKIQREVAKQLGLPDPTEALCRFGHQNLL